MGTKKVAAEQTEAPTVEDWSEKNQRITVRTTPGTHYLADLVLRAKVGVLVLDARAWSQHAAFQLSFCRHHDFAAALHHALCDPHASMAATLQHAAV